jgi:hypothetical protein
VCQNQSGSEGILQALEGGVTVIGEDPRNSLSGESGQRDHIVGVLMDKMLIEVHESEEGLDVLHLTGLRPVLDGFNLFWRHHKSGRRKNIPEILHGIGVEFPLLQVGVESVLTQLSENLLDMLLVGGLILGVN